MTAMDHRGVPRTADRRDDSPHTALELRRQLNPERPGRVAHVSEARRTVAVDCSEKKHVCSDLHYIALVQPTATPRRLELHRHEGSSVSDLLLENVVRLAAKPEARVAEQDGRNDTGVGCDNRRPAAEPGSRSRGAAVPPKDEKAKSAKSADNAGNDQKRDTEARHLCHPGALSVREECEDHEHSGQDEKRCRPDQEASARSLNSHHLRAVLIVP